MMKHLKNYLKDYLQLDEYDIEEEEFGIIPMTDHPLPPNVDKAKRIRRIGIKGGQCKPFLRLYFFIEYSWILKELLSLFKKPSSLFIPLFHPNASNYLTPYS